MSHHADSGGHAAAVDVAGTTSAYPVVGSASVPTGGLQPVTSAYPPGAGYGYQPGRSRAPMIILAMLCVLLLGATGLTSTLYLQQRAETDRANAALVQRNRTIADQASQLAAAKRDLAQAQAEASAAKSDEGKQRSAVDQLSGCVSAVRDLLADLGAIASRLADLQRACGTLF
jgi:hypothetical protein